MCIRDRIVLGKHLVLGDGALAGHQALGDWAAVEEDDLVLVVAVVVVPVEHGSRAFGGKACLLYTSSYCPRSAVRTAWWSSDS